jgi:hypothetical protein
MFRASPTRWNAADGQAVVEALRQARENPIYRPLDANKLKHQPKAFKARIGQVTVPEHEETMSDESLAQDAQPPREPAVHTEVQWILAELGSELGLSVWVASNDRGRQVREQRFTDLRNLRAELPLQFDEATNRTIQLIDVLWLRGNAIAAAFEIESTTSIYSGLLRMSDLIAMQPNINIPLYLVAPDERREKVITEVNRPTFSRLSPPLADSCRFIPFSALRQGLQQYKPVVRYLKPDFLEQLSESCRLSVRAQRG